MESNQGENQKTSEINDKRTEYVQALKIKDDTKNTEIKKIDTEHHTPSRILQKGKKKYPQRRCVVCREKGAPRDTRYCCYACVEVPALCKTPCFKMYHCKYE